MFDGKGRKFADGLEVVAVELVLVDEQVELLQVGIDFLRASGRSALADGLDVGGVHGEELEELPVFGGCSHQIDATCCSVPDLLDHLIASPAQLNSLLLEHHH